MNERSASKRGPDYGRQTLLWTTIHPNFLGADLQRLQELLDFLIYPLCLTISLQVVSSGRRDLIFSSWLRLHMKFNTNWDPGR